MLNSAQCGPVELHIPPRRAVLVRPDDLHPVWLVVRSRVSILAVHRLAASRKDVSPKQAPQAVQLHLSGLRGLSGAILRVNSSAIGYAGDDSDSLSVQHSCMYHARKSSALKKSPELSQHIRR